MLEAAGIGLTEEPDTDCFLSEAFFSPVLPRTAKHGPHGMLVDQTGDPHDASAPSDLETLLATSPLDDTAHLNRARHLMARMAYAQIGAARPGAAESDLPDAPYVLLIDDGQNAGDFNEMAVFAQTEHLGAQLVVYREDLSSDTPLPEGAITAPQDANPWQLFPGAMGVYAHSGFTGFLAIFAEHKPRIFGQPFYAGWGLTSDENPIPRRTRNLTRAQLFAGCILDYPIWYDRFRGETCDAERVFDFIEAEMQVVRRDRTPFVAKQFSRWKRSHIDGFFGQTHDITFARNSREGHQTLLWGKTDPDDTTATRCEDGFLRSRGLGAELIPPLSLVADSSGIYYDASGPSDLEMLIAQSSSLPDFELARAQTLMARLNALKVTKYNLAPSPLPALPEGHKILVPGQVEDDASIRFGCDAVRTNLALLQAAREANPEAVILYKPHPDVVAGLRKGQINPEDVARLADLQVTGDMAELLDAVDEVWTMTSLTGFEALLRGKDVTCLGMPFYAGWGLTRDIGVTPLRRQAKPTLAGLVHATLIGYPRYLDPVTGCICPVEVAVERLSDPTLKLPSEGRLLARLQRLVPYRLRRRGR